MAQLTPLVLKDRKATPVNHTFNPLGIRDGVATVVESSGIPIGDNRVSISLNRNANGRIKPLVKFVFPVVQTETIDGISTPKVVRTAYAEIALNFDSTSSEAERNDVVGMIYNSLAAGVSLIEDTTVRLNGIY